MFIFAAFESVFILKYIFISFILAIAFNILLIAIFLKNARNISVVNISTILFLIIIY